MASLWDAFRRKPTSPPEPKPPLPHFPFVPAFEDAQASNQLGVYAVNPRWYATEATSRVLMDLFGAVGISARQLIEGETVPCRELLFPRGALIPDVSGALRPAEVQFSITAGALAECFYRAPEDTYKSVVFGTLAREWAWQAIRTAHAYAVEKGN